MSFASALVTRARSLAARRQHPHVVVTDGPLAGPHARDVLASLVERPLRQPDDNTCGPSCLVLGRMLRDVAYGTRILADRRPVEAFAHDVKALHRRASLPLDLEKHPQFPWPRALGTRPEAAARVLAAKDGYGAHGAHYGRYLVDPDDPDPVLDALSDTVRAGEPVVVYIGNAVTPRHVVLMVGADDDGDLQCYDPSFGGVTYVSRDAFTRAALGVAGWDVPWLALLPR